MVDNLTYLIGSADPGGLRDAFAFVLLKYDKTDNVIYVLGAKGWKFKSGQIEYPEVEEYVANIFTQYNLDFMVIEKNASGVHVIQSMQRKFHMPIKSVTTSNNIKTDKVIRAGKTMDKTEMVGWINKKRLEGKIKFPRKKTPGILTLENQLNSFIKKATASRQITYSAEGEEHDDFVMAFMVNLFYIRRWIMKDFGIVKRRVLSTKSDSKTSIDLGSGVPNGAIVTSSNIEYFSGISDNPRRYRLS